MNNGFIVLHRKILDWEWADDPLTGWLWVHLLLRANHEAKKWRGISVKRGQLVTTLEDLIVTTGLSSWQVRTRLQTLEESGCITKTATNKYTIVTICKYDDYQNLPNNNDSTATNEPQTNTRKNHKQTTNKKPCVSNGCEVKEKESHKQTTSKPTTNNNITIYNNSHTNSAYVREEEKLVEAWSSEEWRQIVCMNHKLTSELLEDKWQEFTLHCKANDDAHDDVADIRKHFNSWLYQKQYGSNKSNNSKQQSSREERDREAAELVAELLSNCT